MPYLLQGGLGMPEREYYLAGDAEMAALRTKYRDYIANGHDRRRQRRCRGRGAARLRSRDQDRPRPRHPRGERGLRQGRDGVEPRGPRAKAPGIDWGALLGAAQLGRRRNSRPITPARSPSSPRWSGPSRSTRGRTGWRSTRSTSSANVLPAAIRDASFAFNGTALHGTPQQRPRDKLALNAAINALGDAVGKAYVDKYFPASSKAAIQDMVDNIKAAFATRVEALDWMAPGDQGRKR